MKKRNLFFFAASAAAMFLTGCTSSSEEIPMAPAANDGDVQEFVLSVDNTSGNLQTRGRELLSDEAGQEVDNVALYIVDATDAANLKFVKTVEVDWTDADEYANGKKKTVTFKGENKLDVGNYKVYAIGYTDGDYTTLPSFTQGATFSEADFKVAAGTKGAQEIFAGSSDEFSVTMIEATKTVKKHLSGFSVPLVLNRQVAGAYVYAYKIPYVDEMETVTDPKKWTLRLVASDYNNNLVFGALVNEDHAQNTSVKNVVNAYYVAEENGKNLTVAEAKLSDWYKKLVQATKTEGEQTIKLGYLDKALWTTTAEANKDEVVRKGSGYVKGSVFASSFLFPFKAISGKQTFTLELVYHFEENGTQKEKVVKFWNVNNNENATNILVWNGSAFPDTGFNEDSKNSYSILRNHLYALGLKEVDKPGQEDPEDPDPEDNDPTDLSLDQDLPIRVNDNWELIHRMELD